MVKKTPLVIGVLLILVATGLLFLVLFKNELFPEYSPAQRGLLVARNSGCFDCHVRFDGRGSTNPVKGGGMDQVPNFFTERHEVDWIRQWVRNGVSDAVRQRRGAGGEKTNNVLRMPAFGNKLTDEQIDDVAAFVALSQYGQAASHLRELPKGEAIARRHACYTCHGELGQGGVENQGSLKGYIPGFFGDDFRALTRNGNRQDIREWILDGHSRHFWNLGLAGLYPARFFTERQAIQMPAFRDYISEEEIGPLTDHLLELNRRGPLDAESLLALRPLGSHAVTEAQTEVGETVREAAAGPPVQELPMTFLAARTVLEQHCLKCHGPNRQKSRFRLDRREPALQGGEISEATGRATIKPGNAEQSLVIQYVTATEEDPFEEIHPMPPDGNPRLTPSEIEILRRWINGGLPWPGGVGLQPNPDSSGRNN